MKMISYIILVICALAVFGYPSIGNIFILSLSAIFAVFATTRTKRKIEE